MPRVRRRNPIVRPTDIGGGAASAVGRGLGSVGNELVKLGQKRKIENEESRAFDDYMVMKKDYKEYTTSLLSEKIKNEDVDGYSDEVSAYRDTLEQKHSPSGGGGKHYRKAIKGLLDRDEMSLTDGAISAEEQARLTISHSKYNRNNATIIGEAPIRELILGASGYGDDTLLNQDITDNMSANNIADNDKTRTESSDAMRKEIVARVKNADVSQRDYFEKLLDGEDMKMALGNEYSSTKKQFDQNMAWAESKSIKASAVANTELFHGAEKYLTSLSSANLNPSSGDMSARAELSGGEEMSNEELIFAGVDKAKEQVDAQLESGEIDEGTARDLKNYIDTYGKQLVTGERKPLADRTRSVINEKEIEIKQIRGRLTDAGDDQDLRDEAIADYLNAHRELVSLTIGASSLPIDRETMDSLQSMITYAESDIGTELEQREKNFWLRADIDSGDANRVSTPTKSFTDSVRNDTYTSMGLPYMNTIEKHQFINLMEQQMLSFQTERNTQRDMAKHTGEIVPEYDVIKSDGDKTGSQIASEMANGWAQNALASVLGDDYEKRMEPMETKRKFYDKAPTAYENDPSPNKGMFYDSATSAGFTPEEIGAMMDQFDSTAEDAEITKEEGKVDGLDNYFHIDASGNYKLKRTLPIPAKAEAGRTIDSLRNEIGSDEAIRAADALEKQYPGAEKDWQESKEWAKSNRGKLMGALKSLIPSRETQEGLGEKAAEMTFKMLDVLWFGDLKEDLSKDKLFDNSQDGVIMKEIDGGDVVIDNPSSKDNPSGIITRDAMDKGAISSRPKEVEDALTSIASGESFGGSADAMNQGTSGNKIVGSAKSSEAVIGKKISEMTVGELMKHQSKPKGNKDRVFAAGAYQIIPSTMKWAVKEMGIDDSTIFNMETQKSIGEYILRNKQPDVRRYLDGEHNDINKAMRGLSKEWASFPDPKTGKSRYGDGNNVSHTVEDAKKLLVAMRGNI